MKTYKVTATPRFQAWNGSAHTMEIRAVNAKEAIKRARRSVSVNCVFSREDGGISYRAEAVAYSADAS